MKPTVLVLFIALLVQPVHAQNVAFDKVYSTKQLQSMWKKIPQSDKGAFYKQYQRAQLFEEIKNKFTYKKYYVNVLKSFTECVLSYYEALPNIDSIDAMQGVRKIDSIDTIEYDDNSHYNPINKKCVLAKLDSFFRKGIFSGTSFQVVAPHFKKTYD